MMCTSQTFSDFRILKGLMMVVFKIEDDSMRAPKLTHFKKGKYEFPNSKKKTIPEDLLPR